MIGSTIGHYKIEEKLGEGGMGVVYKALDAKLNRPVALKFLPEYAASKAADLERFEQEAKAAAALNHPNICTIYGIEQDIDKHFIVMEFVDGQMLSEKIPSLSLKQAIDNGIQIAEGLAAAHDKGIVHRDLKPENIMIRKDGRVQIMDFGLAKLRGASRLTKEGSTVGTAGYMSPEQVQGQETDHRSDIFSLGVLLYEMLTGHPPFKGMHETAIAYEIVNVDSPPMSAIKPAVPPELDAIVLDCLEKDPAERTQAASQVALELKRYRRESSRQRASRITAARPTESHRASGSSPAATIPGEEPATSGSRSQLTTLLLAIGIPVAAIAGYLISSIFGPSTPGLMTVRATIHPSSGQLLSNDFGGHLALSPDGTMLVYSAIDSAGDSRLWLRRLSANDATRLAGTEGAMYPFWSPDGKQVAFMAGTKLRKVDLLGSPPLDIAEVPQGRGAAWAPNGNIIVCPTIADRSIYSVPSGGGELTPILSLDSTADYRPRFPSFLPDGNHFVFSAYSGGGALSGDLGAFVGSMDGTVRPLSIKGLRSNPFYSEGHLLYLRQNTLIAQAFDVSSLEFTGDPIPLDQGVPYYPARAKGNFTASPNGVLVYVKEALGPQQRLAWIDRRGRATDITPARPHFVASLSPDQGRAAYDEQDDQGNDDIWIYDLQRNIKTRFTFGPETDIIPIWTPDGKQIVYNVVKDNKWSTVVRSADGTGGERTIIDSYPIELWVNDISPDGHSLLMAQQSLNSGFDIMVADLNKPGEIDTLLSTGFHEYFAGFSPDGKWMIYQSGASGRYEIYVRRFAKQSEIWQVSTTGGEGGFWLKTGEIMYHSNGRVMVVRVSFVGGVPQFSVPEELFPLSGNTELTISWPTRDGKRILGTSSNLAAGVNDMSLVVNWQGLAKNK